MQTSGTPAASDRITVPWPACVTTTAACFISSLWGAERHADETLGRQADQTGRRRIARLQTRDDCRDMGRRALFEHGVDQRQADRPPEIAHQVEQAARIRDIGGIEFAQCQRR